MDANDLRPLLAVLVSSAGAGLALVSGRRPNLREAWSVLAALAMFGVLLSMLPDVLAGHAPATAVLALVPGFALRLRADAFGLLFALVASGL